MNVPLRWATLGLTVLLGACSQPAAPTTPEATAPQVPLYNTPSAAPNKYIVVLQDSVLSNRLSSQSGGLISTLGLNPSGVIVQAVYSLALNGFAATLSDQNLAHLRADPRVKYIQRDGTSMRPSAIQSSATWGLDRIDQRDLPLNSTYTYATSASGVTAYVVDTGIRLTHTEFENRAVWGTNATGDGYNTDCNSHGTHVAGTVGGKTYGVAKGVRLVAVKVFPCTGDNLDSYITGGLEWILRNKTTGPAVVNMSLGGPQNQAINDAVTKVIQAGLPVIVAAGNEGVDACTRSPANVSAAITVGATALVNGIERRASGSADGWVSQGVTYASNYGTCLDLFAPGTQIVSALNTNDTGTSSRFGTSMATPHVAGAAALLLAETPSLTPAQVNDALLNKATTGRLSSAGLNSSPNRLLYTGSASNPTPTPTPSVTYTGSITAGAEVYEPKASPSYFSFAGGTVSGTLTGASGTNFDLYLETWNSYSQTWVNAKVSEGPTSAESITYSAPAGYYRWDIYARSGSGTYALTETK